MYSIYYLFILIIIHLYKFIIVIYCYILLLLLYIVKYYCYLLDYICNKCLFTVLLSLFYSLLNK